MKNDYPTFKPEELEPALEYIFDYWRRVVRFQPDDSSTLIGLPQPYIVPTADTNHGYTFNEMYYWDSYFISLGLYGTPYQKVALGMLQNLRFMVKRFGIIPNASRSYMVSRSQPPFLTSYILDVYEARKVKDKRWLKQMMKMAQKEYNNVWMGQVQPNVRLVFAGLSRYFDINYLHDLAEAESGWDMTSRFERRAMDYLPVDLNALLFRYERDFARAAEIRGKTREMNHWLDVSERRRESVDKYLWDEKAGFYFDYNYVENRKSPVWSLAGFYPLWAGLANKDQAARVVANLDKFEFKGGLSTTAKNPDPKSAIPIQWAYPNGWAPLHLLAVYGMENYGYQIEAQRVARKWLRNCLDRFEEDGVFYEKYNVVDPSTHPVEGVYPGQIGFGWTNSVFYRLSQDFLQPDELPRIRRQKKASDKADEFFGAAEQYARRFTSRVRRPFEY